MDAADDRRVRLRTALDATDTAAQETDSSVRRVSLTAAVAGDPSAAAALIGSALGDPDPGVRRMAAELAGRSPEVARELLTPLASMLRDDADALCREAAAFALGESGVDAAATSLEAAVEPERTPVVREAIAAALGALGVAGSVDVVLSMTHGEKPAVRRRALVALAAFDDPRVTPAWEAALADRDRFVREAAEWLLRP